MPSEHRGPRFNYSNEQIAAIKKVAFLVFGFIGVVGIALSLFVTMETWTLLIAALGVGGVIGVHLATQPPGPADR